MIKIKYSDPAIRKVYDSKLNNSIKNKENKKHFSFLFFQRIAIIDSSNRIKQ